MFTVYCDNIAYYRNKFSEIGYRDFSFVATDVHIVDKETGIKPKDFAIGKASDYARDMIVAGQNNFMILNRIVHFGNNRLIPPTDIPEIAYKRLQLLSGRRHRVTTAIIMIKNGSIVASKSVMTIVKMKLLSEHDITSMLASDYEWKNLWGCYNICGFMQRFIKSVNGSYGNISGFPTSKVTDILVSHGVN